MKHAKTLMGFLATCLSLAAVANGTHSGGHGHGADTIGEAGKAEEVTRTVEVEMRDSMRFIPARFAVKQGETIRFVVKNSGKLKHEFVLGSKPDLDAHYEAMKKFPEMEHDDDNMLSLAPGKTGEMVWKFSTAGAVHVACLHPGHYDPGMKGEIRVAAKKSAAR
ncbi:MAG: cupredoxin family protein [Rhodoferax sp.]|nr:cupredoxin family protein [Rhodoferax sp.]